MFRSLILSAVALLTAPTSAAGAAPPPWIVSANAAVGSTVSFKAATSGPQPQLVVTDVTTGVQIECTASSLGGGGVTGSYPTGSNLIHVVAQTFAAAHCAEPVSGLPYRPLGEGGNWPFTGITYNGAPPAAGITLGRLMNIYLTWSTPGGCTFNYTGGVRARYFNHGNTPYLSLYSAATNLTVGNAVSCGPQFATGDTVTMVATYYLATSPTSPIYIYR